MLCCTSTRSQRTARNLTKDPFTQAKRRAGIREAEAVVKGTASQPGSPSKLKAQQLRVGRARVHAHMRESMHTRACAHTTHTRTQDFVFGRTGAMPKAKNNKDGALIAEAKGLLTAALLLPNTPSTTPTTTPVSSPERPRMAPDPRAAEEQEEISEAEEEEVGDLMEEDEEEEQEAEPNPYAHIYQTGKNRRRSRR